MPSRPADNRRQKGLEVMKLKQIQNKDFQDRIDVYQGIKDYYGKSCLLLVNNDLMEWKLVQKYANYEHRKRFFQRNKMNVIPEKYGTVIDVSKETFEQLTAIFEGYRHPSMQVWDYPAGGHNDIQN